MIKIITWNVNGLNARIKSGDIDKLLENQAPDLVLLQEIKCKTSNFSNIDYAIKLNPAERAGFHGTGVIYKKTFIDSKKIESITLENHEDEGRIQKIKLPDMTIVNVYVPNSGVDPKQPLNRLSYRTNIWDKDFRKYLNQLSADNKNVLICGDLNVAYNDYDVHNPKSLSGKAGFTKQERDSFKLLINDDFIDLWDKIHPDSRNIERFTFYGRFQKKFNRGWRLDYILANVDNNLNIDNMKIIADVDTSDHLPLMIELI